MNIRTSFHSVIDFLFEKSLYISGILLVILSVIDISNLNNYKHSFYRVENFPFGKIFYYTIVGLSLLFGIFAVQNAKDVSDLEKDILEKGRKIADLETSFTELVNEMNDLFNSYLTLLVTNLNFTHTERISVYKVYEDKFVLIGRSSVNPILKKRGRGNYPIREGFIGKGWAEGELFVDDLPDPSHKLGNSYFSRVNSINSIPREVISKMNMLSRTYFVHRLCGYDSEPKAIIVIESQKEKAFTKDEVINKLMEVNKPLVMFIEKNNGINLSSSNNLGL